MKVKTLKTLGTLAGTTLQLCGGPSLQAALQVKARGRARERARQAAERKRVQSLQRQRCAPETPEAVHAWHAADRKRRER